MIDTGAASTCIQEGIVSRLDLKFVGKVTIHTPSSTMECYIYPLHLQFSNGFGVDISDVIAAPLPGQNIQCLIGRDVLALGVLTYSGRANRFTLRL
jgi:hypothetical protein